MPLKKIKNFVFFVLYLTGVQHVRRMGHGVPAHFKPIRQICEENKNHMNFMPVPEGSWQEYHNARNSKMNLMLAASVASVAVTFATVSATYRKV